MDPILIVLIVAFVGAMIYIFLIMDDVSEDEEALNQRWEPVAQATGLELKPFDGNRFSLSMEGEVDGVKLDVMLHIEESTRPLTIDIGPFSVQRRYRRRRLYEEVKLIAIRATLHPTWPKSASLYRTTLQAELLYRRRAMRRMGDCDRGKPPTFVDVRTSALEQALHTSPIREELIEFERFFGDYWIKEGELVARLLGASLDPPHFEEAIARVASMANLLADASKKHNSFGDHRYIEPAQDPVESPLEAPAESGSDW